MAIWPQKPHYSRVFGVYWPFFHELHLLFFLWVDSILNWTTFRPVWTNHNHLGTVSYQFGIFSNVISNHCGLFLIFLQYIFRTDLCCFWPFQMQGGDADQELYAIFFLCLFVFLLLLLFPYIYHLSIFLIYFISLFIFWCYIRIFPRI